MDLISSAKERLEQRTKDLEDKKAELESIISETQKDEEISKTISKSRKSD